MESRDKEIERLNRQLDGGRPVDAVLREGKKDSSERVVAHLNVQVCLCTLFHCSALHCGVEPLDLSTQSNSGLSEGTGDR